MLRSCKIASISCVRVSYLRDSRVCLYVYFVQKVCVCVCVIERKRVKIRRLMYSNFSDVHRVSLL